MYTRDSLHGRVCGVRVSASMPSSPQPFYISHINLRTCVGCFNTSFPHLRLLYNFSSRASLTDPPPSRAAFRAPRHPSPVLIRVRIYVRVSTGGPEAKVE